MFSSIAHAYDLNNTLLSFGLHHFWKRKAIHLARLRPGERIVDLGAGTGDLARLAAKKIEEDGLIIALDLNEPMLRVGQHKLSAFPSLAYLRANAESLPLKNESVDILLTGFCLRNVSNLEIALKEILRVLKPNGRMICLEFSRPPSKLLRALYNFYSFTLLPVLGTYIAKDRTGVYRYLPASIRQFPDQAQFSEKLSQAGFGSVSYQNQTGGIVAIHTGKKEGSHGRSVMRFSDPDE